MFSININDKMRNNDDRILVKYLQETPVQNKKENYKLNIKNPFQKTACENKPYSQMGTKNIDTLKENKKYLELNENYKDYINNINSSFSSSVTANNKKLTSVNSSIISTEENTTVNKFKSGAIKPGNSNFKKTTANHSSIPKINQNTYILSNNKFLKMKIPKLNNDNALSSRATSGHKVTINSYGTTQTISETTTLNLIKNSKIKFLINQEEEKYKSRNEKIKLIEQRSDNLYKRKTFSTDYNKKDKIKQEIDEIRIRQEMEDCTFKPKIHRNAVSTFVSAQNSPIMTAYNSQHDISFGNVHNTYDKQVEWKSKVKSRYNN
jgi:hypothetical protein